MKNTIKNNKWLILIAIFLLTANLILLIIIATGQKNETTKTSSNTVRNNFEQQFASELKLNNEQRELYRTLREEHFAEIKKYKKQIRQFKNSIITEMSKENPDIEHINSLSDSIANAVSEIQKANYMHFLQIKKHLTPEQADCFMNILNKKTKHW